MNVVPHLRSNWRAFKRNAVHLSRGAGWRCAKFLSRRRAIRLRVAQKLTLYMCVWTYIFVMYGGAVIMSFMAGWSRLKFPVCTSLSWALFRQHWFVLVLRLHLCLSPAPASTEHMQSRPTSILCWFALVLPLSSFLYVRGAPRFAYIKT